VSATIETGRCNVPALGFGTWRLEGREAYDMVRHALDVGYRHLDTAQMYGNEEEVGRAVADSGLDRDQVFLTTKIHPDNAAPADVAASTEASLRRLGTEHVDLLLLHWPSDAVPLEATLEAMTRLVDEHRTRYIGVSNFPSQALEQAVALAPIVTDQVEHHPYLAVDAIAEVADEHDLFVTAYSPLARGRILDDETLADIADAHGATVAQVVLAWLIQRGVAAIPKSATPARIEENHGALDVALTDAELTRISALDQGLRLVDPPFAPAWD
jgi:2,5-diketo-D-gluconate reductase B